MVHGDRRADGGDALAKLAAALLELTPGDKGKLAALLIAGDGKR